jgi:hypothetical protein
VYVSNRVLILSCAGMETDHVTPVKPVTPVTPAAPSTASPSKSKSPAKSSSSMSSTADDSEPKKAAYKHTDETKKMMEKIWGSLQLQLESQKTSDEAPKSFDLKQPVASQLTT